MARLGRASKAEGKMGGRQTTLVGFTTSPIKGSKLSHQYPNGATALSGEINPSTRGSPKPGSSHKRPPSSPSQSPEPHSKRTRLPTAPLTAAEQADPNHTTTSSHAHPSNPANSIGNVDTNPSPPGSDAAEVKGKIATFEAGQRADADPPVKRLERALAEHGKGWAAQVEKGLGMEGREECVVYWMRMQDMRLKDNRALSLASSLARQQNLPILTIFLFTPGDYEAHDRSPRRIDFMLRNLRALRLSLSALHIPLYTCTIDADKRRKVPERVLEVCEEYGARAVYANIEYEVDELGRDERAVRLLGGRGVRCEFLHDRCVVQPGRVLTKEGKPYTVYSPWLRNWVAQVQNDPSTLACASPVQANPDPSLLPPKLADLLHNPTPIPDQIPDFECEDREKMALLWPEGEDVAAEVLRRFLRTKARKEQLGGGLGVLAPGAEEDVKHSRVMEYSESRSLVDRDSSSRLSPYLASGIISARECLRQALALSGRKRLEASDRSESSDGVQMWTQEIAWRDFYTHVLASFPRVSMGRPFLEKFNDVKWELSPPSLSAFKAGLTGYPIVDAAMRQCNAMGWMPNRVRMIVASFLVKDLGLDWRLGERVFMGGFVDGDLASNNGGWQWVASTGTDPQPYFRIFHPVTQAEKADPTGTYIRHFVPELRHLKGKVIYAPWERMPEAEFRKLGYPKPIVDHKFARERALRRYKNPGSL